MWAQILAPAHTSGLSSSHSVFGSLSDKESPPIRRSWVRLVTQLFLQLSKPIARSFLRAWPGERYYLKEHMVCKCAQEVFAVFLSRKLIDVKAVRITP